MLLFICYTNIMFSMYVTMLLLYIYFSSFIYLQSRLLKVNVELNDEAFG